MTKKNNQNINFTVAKKQQNITWEYQNICLF